MKYVDKSYSGRSIHLGIVACCNKGDKYGLLYGLRNKLFYFEKDSSFELANNTLVSYLSGNYNENTSKVDYVYPVSSLVKHNDTRDTCRADNFYHDDETWRLINEGIPYFDYSHGRQYCIYYPIIKDNVCTIWRGLFGAGIYMDKEAHIYELTRELYKLNYSGWPSLDEVLDEINKIKVYLDSFNVNEIIDTYRIEQVNTYHSKPGGDDSYSEHTYWKLQCNDGYLDYLLPTKDELTFFDGNAYRSDGYTEGRFLLEKETLQARAGAKKEYSKEKHMAFLIRDYFADIEEKKERSNSLKEALFDEFDIEGASEIVKIFRGSLTDNIMTLINEYNNSTVIDPQETHSKNSKQT